MAYSCSVVTAKYGAMEAAPPETVPLLKTPLVC
jgi:hypothetical protein